MNVRSAGDHLAMGNRISSLFVHLPVAASDPAERYRLQVEEAEALKAGTQHEGSSILLDLGNHMPPVLHSFVARSLFATRLFNVTVTNVPGPQTPLYYFGSQVEEIWPLVPIAAAHAIGLAVFSYDGTLFFCLNVDRDTCPRRRGPQGRDRELDQRARASWQRPRRRPDVPGPDPRTWRPGSRHRSGDALDRRLRGRQACPGLPHLRLGARRRPSHLVLPDRRHGRSASREPDLGAGRPDHPGPDPASPGQGLQRAQRGRLRADQHLAEPQRISGSASSPPASAPGRLLTVPASEIASRQLGRPLPNTALLGGFAAMTGVVTLEAVVQAIGAEVLRRRRRPQHARGRPRPMTSSSARSGS